VAGSDSESASLAAPDAENFFESEKWASVFKSLLDQFGNVVHELYGPNGKIRKFCESHHSEAKAYERKLPPYFRVLFQPLGWWPSDFLKVAGFIAWDFKPFWDGFRLLHNVAQLPRRGNQSPVLLPGRTGKSRLEVANDAISWSDFKQLPEEIQQSMLGRLMFPLFGDAGHDDDAVRTVSDQARDELRRFLKVEHDLLSARRPRASLRHLRTLVLFESLREQGNSWQEAEERLAAEQGRTGTAIHGDVQRAMRDLKLSRQELDNTLRRRDTSNSEVAAELCVVHGKPVDELLTCPDCRNEAKLEFPSD